MPSIRRFRSAAWTLPSLLLVAAACSSSGSEPVDTSTAALSTKTWVDGNVQSFKPLAVPSVPGLVYVLGTDGNLWREVGSMAHRTWVDGSVRDYQPTDGQIVYVLGTNGNLWREVGSMTVRSQVASGVSGFQVATDGSGFVYYTDAASTLWLKRPSGSTQVLAYSVLGFQAPGGLAGSSLYVLRSDRSLVRGWPDFINTEVIDSSVASFWATDAQTVLVEGTDSKLWSENFNSSTRNLVDTNVEFFKAFDNITTFIEDDSFGLWREEFGAHNRDRVDVNVKAYAPIAKDAVYVLDFDGNLWEETLPDPVCNYTFDVAPQAGLYVDAWGIATKSGTCPVIQAGTGKWSNMVNGYMPNVPSQGLWVPPTPTCATNGLPSNCCIYVWTPSPGTEAIQDPSVLCTADATPIVAYVGNELVCPVNETCLPGGGGCPTCLGGFR